MLQLAIVKLMELVLLPHHNTLSSLMNCQSRLAGLFGKGFMPRFPLVAPLGTIDDAVCRNGVIRSRQFDDLRRRLKGLRGACCFGPLSVVATADDTQDVLIALQVPFIEALEAAGIRPAGQVTADGTAGAVRTAAVRLGTLLPRKQPYTAGQGTDGATGNTDGSGFLTAEAPALMTADEAAPAQEELSRSLQELTVSEAGFLPASFSVFRLALMESTEGDALSWTYPLSCWVKLS